MRIFHALFNNKIFLHSIKMTSDVKMFLQLMASRIMTNRYFDALQQLRMLLVLRTWVLCFLALRKECVRNA